MERQKADRRMLSVTCHEDCLLEMTNTTCLAHFGCAWDPVESHCQINKDATVDGQGWIGVLLSLLGDIIINIGMNSMKYAHNGNMHETTGEPIQHYLRLPLWYNPRQPPRSQSTTRAENPRPLPPYRPQPPLPPSTAPTSALLSSSCPRRLPSLLAPNRCVVPGAKVPGPDLTPPASPAHPSPAVTPQ